MNIFPTSWISRRVIVSNLIAQSLGTVLLGAFASSAQAYVPAPSVANTDYIIGAHYMPAFKEGTHMGWEQIAPWQRTPKLGYYDEGSPEVADWQIKWAKENGISFFDYDWFRSPTNFNHAITNPAQDLPWSHALHDGFMNAQFRNNFKFTINWCNVDSSGGTSGLNDFTQNVVPYWVNTYFKNPSYLKVDGKPVVDIQAGTHISDQFGGTAGAQAALQAIRDQAAAAGFPGVYILGGYDGWDTSALQGLKDFGYDANVGYTMYGNQGWQAGTVQSWKNKGILPFVATASPGMDRRPCATSWASARAYEPDAYYADGRCHLTSANYQWLLQNEKAIMDSMPAGSISRKMAMLGTWNEWGEGTQVEPSEQDGFGYIQAVRDVFTAKDNTPNYLSPKEQGFGPYDTRYRNFFAPNSQGIIYKDNFNRVGPMSRYGEGESVHPTISSLPTAGMSALGGWYSNTISPNCSTDGTQLVKTAGQGNLYLPFTPADGKKYRLSADIKTTMTQQGQYISLGFTNGDDPYADWSTEQSAVAWWKSPDNSLIPVTCLGPDLYRYDYSNIERTAGYDNYAVELDTTQEHWRVLWFLNGHVVRGDVFETNPTISWIGIGGTAAGYIDNFTLMAPEPSAIILVGTALLALGGYVSRKKWRNVWRSHI
jgi:hypothetical protein